MSIGGEVVMDDFNPCDVDEAARKRSSRGSLVEICKGCHSRTVKSIYDSYDGYCGWCGVTLGLIKKRVKVG